MTSPVLEVECVRLRQLGVIPSDAICTSEELRKFIEEHGLEERKVVRLGIDEFFKTAFKGSNFIMALVFKCKINAVYITRANEPHNYIIGLYTGKKHLSKFIKLLMQICGFSKPSEFTRSCLKEVVVCRVDDFSKDVEWCRKQIREMYRGFIINSIHTLMKIAKAGLTLV